MSDFDRAAAFIRRSLGNHKFIDGSDISRAHSFVKHHLSRHTSAPAALVRRAPRLEASSPRKTEISLPMVNPGEKLKIWQGRGPLVTLGDVAVPIFAVPEGAILAPSTPRDPPLIPMRAASNEDVIFREATPVSGQAAPISVPVPQVSHRTMPKSVPKTTLQHTPSQETIWSDFIGASHARESEFFWPAPLRVEKAVRVREAQYPDAIDGEGLGPEALQADKGGSARLHHWKHGDNEVALQHNEVNRRNRRDGSSRAGNGNFGRPAHNWYEFYDSESDYGDEDAAEGGFF